MKYLVLALSFGLLTACAQTTPVPSEIAAVVAKKSIDELPAYSSIEQRRCSKAKFSSVQEKTECTHAVKPF